MYSYSNYEGTALVKKGQTKRKSILGRRQLDSSVGRLRLRLPCGGRPDDIRRLVAVHRSGNILRGIAAAVPGRASVVIGHPQPLKQRAVECCSDEVHRPRRYQRPRHQSPHHLPLRPRQRYRERRIRRRRRGRRAGGKDGCGDREEVEVAVEGDGGAGGGGRLFEGNVRDDAVAAEDAEADAPPPAKPRRGVDDVDAGRQLEDVRAHRRPGRRVLGEDDRRLRFVFGTRGPATGAADNFDSGAVAGD
ncbi:nuclear matrix protein-related [Striga asiatica]|uniref:Nuclear matrix protein-related n=1 Tax=Striga asiatica TaxID=4170 RepID=A0A5A7Q5S8_STRAF|nr:nuclear matrix protein-related [Striga asiatica]